MAQKKNKMARREEKEGVCAETYNGLKGFVWAKAHVGCTTFVRVNSVYPEIRVFSFELTAPLLSSSSSLFLVLSHEQTDSSSPALATGASPYLTSSSLHGGPGS